MTYGSVCSGIEAATVAWHPLGWQPAFFSEIEPFPCAALKHHYPAVPNLGDMTKFKDWPDYAISLLVGGTPCQAFSVAGLRKGLADPRGNLTLTYLAIAARYRPQWICWENVPGVLSDTTGAFASFLGGLAELGYGWAYRILDAQYFGVAQRRRRVFVVGYLGDWRRAAAVLFERHSLQGNPPPSRKARERPTPTLSARTKGGGGLGTDFDLDGGLIASEGKQWPAEIAPTLNAAFGDKQGLEDQHALNGAGLFVPARPIALSSGQTNASITIDKAPSLDCLHEAPIIAYTLTSSPSAAATPNEDATLIAINPEVANCLTTSNQRFDPQTETLVNAATAVRRLTPRECERLQGFPDDYTLVPYRGKPAADGPRYKALGNSMAVPVMRWIGRRIQQVSAL